MIKYSLKRFGSCDSAFCRFVPIFNGHPQQVVPFMESQNYIKYLKYKMPRKFGGTLFYEFIERYMNSSRPYDFVNTNRVSRVGTGKLSYVFTNKCVKRDVITGEITFDDTAFRDGMHEACQVGQFSDKEFLIPYRLENLISEEQWYNIIMPMIYNYFGHSDKDIYICNVSIDMPDMEY